MTPRPRWGCSWHPPGHRFGTACKELAGGERANLNEKKKKTLGPLPAFSLPIVLPAWVLLSPGQLYVSKAHKFSFFHWAGGVLLGCAASCRVLCPCCPVTAAQPRAMPSPIQTSCGPRPRQCGGFGAGACFPGGEKGRLRVRGFQTEAVGLSGDLRECPP